MTVDLQLEQAFATLVTTALAGLATVEADRDAALQPTPGALPLVAVYGEAPQEIHRVVGARRYAKVLRVEGAVARVASADLRPLVDTLVAPLLVAVRADSRLGGLAIRTEDGESELEIMQAAGASPTATFVQRFVVEFETTDDPEQTSYAA